RPAPCAYAAPWRVPWRPPRPPCAWESGAPSRRAWAQRPCSPRVEEWRRNRTWCDGTTQRPLIRADRGPARLAGAHGRDILTLPGDRRVAPLALLALWT